MAFLVRRNPLHARSVLVRPWAFAVNSLSASPFVSRPIRSWILRLCGLEVETDLIYPRCYFHTANIRVAPSVILNHGVHIENVARVEIGARSGLGVGTVVLTSNHELGSHRRRFGPWRREPVTIGEGCWIGARSLILGGVTIGDGCVIAAGSVVREDCQPDGLYAGVPARRVRDLPPD
jgi:acetyltransferase-like isoleucine patch superfamily enzyme